jgi:hypothetical protein
VRDEHLRMSCFLWLEVLRARLATTFRTAAGVDQDLVGESDYEVHVAPRLLDEKDGPMLDVLKQFHRSALAVPAARAKRPDRELLAAWFDRFLVR